MKYVECNGCKQMIYLIGAQIGHVEEGDLHIDYFTCPYCGKKYVSFASDVPMRELITRRRALQEKLKVAQANKFREKTIRQYVRAVDKIKAQQEKMMPALLERANAAVAGEGADHGEEEEKEG